MNEPLAKADALRCRQQLVDDGYTIIPGVMSADLLTDLRNWSDDVFDRLPVNPKFRYQGSDIQVATARSWPADRVADERRFADPIVERIIDQPHQLAVCAAIGGEGFGRLQKRTRGQRCSAARAPRPAYWCSATSSRRRHHQAGTLGLAYAELCVIKTWPYAHLMDAATCK